MSLYDDSNYRRKLEHCDNIYVEVQYIMNEAREIAKSTDYKLRHSQAITCVVQGKSATELLQQDNNTLCSEEDKLIAEMYCTIDNKDICDAVYDSYFDSKDAGHLIYTYNNIIDEPQRSRVRVITKMLWYKLRAY